MPGGLHLRGWSDALHPPGRMRGLWRVRAGVPRTRHLLRGRRPGGVEAAIRTLRERGFAGASVRAIAQTGGFNQALVFYHFGTVNNLLLAALDATSSRRMERYRAVTESITTLPELMEKAVVVYRED